MRVWRRGHRVVDEARVPLPLPRPPSDRVAVAREPQRPSEPAVPGETEVLAPDDDEQAHEVRGRLPRRLETPHRRVHERIPRATRVEPTGQREPTCDHRPRHHRRQGRRRRRGSRRRSRSRCRLGRRRWGRCATTAGRTRRIRRRAPRERGELHAVWSPEVAGRGRKADERGVSFEQESQDTPTPPELATKRRHHPATLRCCRRHRHHCRRSSSCRCCGRGRGRGSPRRRRGGESRALGRRHVHASATPADLHLRAVARSAEIAAPGR